MNLIIVLNIGTEHPLRLTPFGNKPLYGHKKGKTQSKNGKACITKKGLKIYGYVVIMCQV